MHHVEELRLQRQNLRVETLRRYYPRDRDLVLGADLDCRLGKCSVEGYRVGEFLDHRCEFGTTFEWGASTAAAAVLGPEASL